MVFNKNNENNNVIIITDINIYIIVLIYFITSKTHFKSSFLLVNGAATLASASDCDKPT